MQQLDPGEALRPPGWPYLVRGPCPPTTHPLPGRASHQHMERVAKSPRSIHPARISFSGWLAPGERMLGSRRDSPDRRGSDVKCVGRNPRSSLRISCDNKIEQVFKAREGILSEISLPTSGTEPCVPTRKDSGAGPETPCTITPP